MSKGRAGTPVYQRCNNVNNILLERYTSLKSEETRLIKEIEERQHRINEIRTEYKDLNVAEVNNVLDYVRTYSYSDKLSKNEIDALFCHCQNKLNGNINSVFLTFKNPTCKEN